MSVSIRQGDIVWLAIADPQGGNIKTRAIVVVSPDEAIARGDVLAGVAISGEYRDLDAASYVVLPHHQRKHPQTGLKKPCAAICSWAVRFPASDVKSVEGAVPNAQLQRILDVLDRLAQDDEHG